MHGMALKLPWYFYLLTNLKNSMDPFYGWGSFVSRLYGWGSFVSRLQSYYKETVYFLPFGCYFQVWSCYYPAEHCNQKTPVPVSSRWQVRFGKAKKKASIINHNYHQHSSTWVSLNWSNNKIKFSFNQPSSKWWRVRLVDVIKHLPHSCFKKYVMLWFNV